jgi:hypothetical protein
MAFHSTPSRTFRRTFGFGRAAHLATAAGILGVLASAVATATAPGTADAMGLPRPATQAHLTVAYDDGAGHTRTYRVRCDATGDTGDTTDDRAGDACRRLTEIGGPVAPVPAGQACSMIYGGPQTAKVSGVWGGRDVQESYRRTNGCEVARWSRMVPVLPNPGKDLGNPEQSTVAHRNLKG